MLGFIFAGLVVLGQTGQNVTLPLWLDSVTMDPYFVLIFASASYVVIFAVCWFVSLALGWVQTPTKVNHRDIALTGLCNALNGCMLVFAAPGKRTPPFLQSILGNFLVPLTVVLRYLFFGNLPNRTQSIAAFTVVISLFICLVPKIFDLDQASNAPPTAPGAWRIFWPLIFMFGFVPLAVMTVLEEKILKSNNLPILYFLLLNTLWQLAFMLCLFWIDIIPKFGFSEDLSEFMDNMSDDFHAFRTESIVYTRAMLFIGFYCVFYMGNGLLLRYTEGATWQAVIATLCTPLGTLFYTIFEENPFHYNPQWIWTDWFVIGGLTLMLPAIYIYKRYGAEDEIREKSTLQFVNRDDLNSRSSIQKDIDKDLLNFVS